MPSTEWNTPRRTEACAGCQRPFEPGQPFRAFLYQSAETYTRHDYCDACAPPPEPAPVGMWRTRRPSPSAPAAPVFDREAIYRFFERLEDDQAASAVQFRFVLSLLLWRKKALKLERTATFDNREVWEFATPGGGPLHRVVRPELDEAQLENLSNQVEQLLSGAGGSFESLVTAADKENENA